MAKIEMFYKKPTWDRPECVYRYDTSSDDEAEVMFCDFRNKDTWTTPFRERKVADYYFLCVVTYSGNRNHERSDFGGYFDGCGYKAVHEMYKTFGAMFNTRKGKSLYKAHKIKWALKTWALRLAFLACACFIAHVVVDFNEIAHKVDVRLGLATDEVPVPVVTTTEDDYRYPDSTWCGELNGDYVTCRNHFRKMMKEWYGENKYTLSNFSNVYYEIKGNNLYLYSYSLRHGADRLLLLYKLYPYITDCDFETVYASAYYNGGENFAVMYERGDVRPHLSNEMDTIGYPKPKYEKTTMWTIIKCIYPPYAREQDRLEKEHTKAVFDWLARKAAERDEYKEKYRADFIAHKDSLYKQNNIKY